VDQVTDWQVRGFKEVRELGRGGQGRVVLARHARAGTPVAIKYLPAEADPDSRERFRHESQMLGRVTHPHVARLYRLVENDNGIAIVMEAVNGVPLTKVLAHHRTLEPEAALTVLKGSLLGLAAAHNAGVVHRDYKPANVIVPADGRSKLIDFGVAVYSGEGSFAGTPYYMAPEQWRGEPTSPATDVYAATCVFYECVTGRRPYPPGDRAAIRAGHLNTPVPVEHVPERLRPLITRGMAKDPAERPDSAEAFVEELEHVARTTYGADWEKGGMRALAGGVVALAALFPLTAAGLASAGGAATATAGTTGVLGALGTKAGVAVAGTAVATATVGGGVGVYQATRPEPVERPVASTVSPSPPGKRLDLGDFSITTPLTWRVTRMTGELGGYEIRVPGRCTPKTEYRAEICPDVKVLGRQWIDPPLDARIESYQPSYAWHPGTDPSHDCPPRPSLPAARGERLLKKSFVQVGGRTAEYREWRMQCGDGGARPVNVFFVQRLWYLPTSRILIVDEWNTPNLAQILTRAQWT
jgi:predicted Ser/Thr protein kinase